MKQITVQTELMFDADQVTSGDIEKQAKDAVEILNLHLQREPYGLAAQIGIHWDKPITTEEVE